MPDMVCESPLCGPRSGPSQTRSHPAASDVRLCPVCRDKLAKDLQQIPALYYQCEQILVSRYKRGTERIRGGLPGGISLNDAAFTARSDMLAVLVSWSGLVVDERPVSVAPRRRIDALAEFLVVHLDWLAAHPAAGYAVAEVHDVTRKATAAIDPYPEVRLALGPCVQDGCERTVHARVQACNSAPTQVSCGAGHVWRPHEWLRLGYRIEQAQRALNNGAE